MPKYSPLAGDTNQVSFFSLHKMIKMSKQQRFIHKLSVTYWGSVNHQKSVHHTLSTQYVGLGNTMIAFKTNQLALLYNERQVYFCLAELKGEGRPFLEGHLQIYPLNHLLHMRVRHPLSTLPVKIRNTLVAFKTNK